ncbi:MAG: hypothetical protein HUJ22_07865 [Gracilimonas sp.]|uniref:hypothetical protein n=1 Tax=Gracilimonas sp. TaxID=1974203 RepID=UPI0019B596C5|nr:hypothetical protein [Gracilimonas sp.]MBD3616473.1 hypothetical protein [Gracilimonas sp.]MBD3616474.1 hypothetical protein [Gracilimonas sp.]
MKSLKSLFALAAIVTLSFGCASVTDASLTEELNKTPDTQITSSDDGVFSGGNDVEPIVEKPW